MASIRFLTFTFWNYYVLKHLRLETITFSDGTLSEINIVLCTLFRSTSCMPCCFFSFSLGRDNNGYGIRGTGDYHTPRAPHTQQRSNP
jgi:hypothetical protein